MEVVLLFPEPQPVLDDIVGTIFGHLTKEGVNVRHLSSLISNSLEGHRRDTEEVQERRDPAAVKALTLYRLDGVLEILSRREGARPRTRALQRDCDRLAEKVRKFVAMFELEGFGSGTFDEVEKVFKKYKFDLGRKDFYRAALEGRVSTTPRHQTSSRRRPWSG